VAQFKYLGTTVTNQNLIQEEIKRRLITGSVCYYSVQYSIQNPLSFCLLSKNIKIRIYKTIILPSVLYGYETWFVISRNEHGLRVSENRMLNRIFVPKRGEMIRNSRKLPNEELHRFYSSPSIIIVIKIMMIWARYVTRMGIRGMHIGL
jgi:hypothetical protein